MMAALRVPGTADMIAFPQPPHAWCAGPGRPGSTHQNAQYFYSLPGGYAFGTVQLAVRTAVLLNRGRFGTI